jgi:2-(3-amino-3-carboxypropyl)histidine synthase
MINKTLAKLTFTQAARTILEKDYILQVPQAKPLSPGEVLGCTSPKLPDMDAIMYVKHFIIKNGGIH